MDLRLCILLASAFGIWAKDIKDQCVTRTAQVVQCSLHGHGPKRKDPGVAQAFVL